ncbi:MULTISPECIES: bactofilin family protein [Bacillaceae]|uniref:Polymer-forming cytoskeletal protein n=1 Tax=Evansella alkalicola TaxID=745819 RepID=A0ABS6JYA4_9BACI|nr:MULTISPECIES: polymer-forming cytoskeletal protein [Bacillaceae]MBU9722085.1 polymer-forming cytoskeletal protein [Bacillus alkalicola]
MFTKQKNERKLNQISTVIGEETIVEGRIHIESSIRVDGKVYGEIRSAGDITIGKEGHVEKAVSARNLFLAGSLKGNAKIDNKIHIYDTGHLDGIAEMETIIIDEKGHFQGKSIMKNTQKVKANVIEIEKDAGREKKENQFLKEKHKDNHHENDKEKLKDIVKDYSYEKGSKKEVEVIKNYQDHSM